MRIGGVARLVTGSFSWPFKAETPYGAQIGTPLIPTAGPGQFHRSSPPSFHSTCFCALGRFLGALRAIIATPMSYLGLGMPPFLMRLIVGWVVIMPFSRKSETILVSVSPLLISFSRVSRIMVMTIQTDINKSIFFLTKRYSFAYSLFHQHGRHNHDRTSHIPLDRHNHTETAVCGIAYNDCWVSVVGVIAKRDGMSAACPSCASPSVKQMVSVPSVGFCKGCNTAFHMSDIGYFYSNSSKPSQCDKCNTITYGPCSCSSKQEKL